MKEITQPSVRLSERLDRGLYGEIDRLKEICIAADGTALKLELDYKLALAETEPESGRPGNFNEFLFFSGGELIGYIGICGFGQEALEINGMVHPEYRGRGVFTRLFGLVSDEWQRRAERSMLLLTDRLSAQGQAFAKQTGAVHAHSEYEMFLTESGYRSFGARTSEEYAAAHPAGIVLRKATNADALEVNRQNAVYFGEAFDGDCPLMPEEEERRGMTVYLAELDGAVIGKIHLERSGDLGAVFGFGVEPACRRRGYGREILIAGIEKLIESGARRIMLQVEAKNEKALQLYLSCGFAPTSTMDYYILKK